MTDINTILVELHETYERQNRSLKEDNEIQARELTMLRAQTAAVRNDTLNQSDDDQHLQRELSELKQRLADSEAMNLKLITERVELKEDDPQLSPYGCEVVLNLTRVCAEVKHVCESEIREKRALQTEVADLRSKLEESTASKEGEARLMRELSITRLDLKSLELAYSKLRVEFDHKHKLVNELAADGSNVRLQLRRLCDDYEDLCASSKVRELEDRDKYEHLLDKFYSLRDAYADVLKERDYPAPPSIRSSPLSSPRTTSPGGTINGIAYHSRKHAASPTRSRDNSLYPTSSPGRNNSPGRG